MAEALVVGAGPVGLTAAHELLRRGVAVRIVDRAAGPAPTSRATANHARTLETYHQMGVLDDLLARGQRAENFTVHMRGRELTRLGTDYSRLPTRFPFTLQVDQTTVEQVLRDRLHAFGSDVEWSTELVSLRQEPDRVSVRLRGPDGTAEDLTTPWLVGADGGHSTVRDRLGLRLSGESSEQWLVADAIVHADLRRDSLHWMHTRAGSILLVPFPAPGKWRLLDTADANRNDTDETVRLRFAGKISQALGTPVEVDPPTWVSVFTIQQRMIDRMGIGRCFVAGDAAHVHSPASGQGMNTGIQDAVNLAWKLADVIRGRAGARLLDSYSAERVPVGAVLLGSTQTATSLIALREAAAPVLLPAGLWLLNTLAPVKRGVERKILKGMSGLALHYAGSPLTRAAGGRAGIAPGHRVACSAGTERRSRGWQTLSAELTDPRWTLVGFAGDPALPAALAEVDRRYRQAVSVRTASETGRPPGPHPLADPGGTLRTDLLGPAGNYALIRPDGYLAARGTAREAAELESLLRGMHLIPATPGERDAPAAG